MFCITAVNRNFNKIVRPKVSKQGIFFMTKSFKEGNCSSETNVSALITISFVKMTAHGHFGQWWKQLQNAHGIL